MTQQRVATYSFGGLRFSLMTRSSLHDWASRWIETPGASMSVTLTGAHGIRESKLQAQVRRAHEDADLILSDGTPPYLAAVLYGLRRQVDRLPGRSAMSIVAVAAAEAGILQVFVGGPPGLAERTLHGLETMLSTRINAMTYSPPFATVIDAHYAREIANWLAHTSPPAIVWIGLSTPKQEVLMRALKEYLPKGYCFFAVGAAFDMYAGTRRPAPPVVSRAGLEWLYRLAQEPRRLTSRYLHCFPVITQSLICVLIKVLTDKFRASFVRAETHSRSEGVL